ncbi:hypothetical protein [Halobacillus naozhouensis]|uniref:Uncharacterized protein n=1 Tax=Halobacillus naozhouensis TaxID=554880 RepID=A0ABY8J166_9BACI|nr:hypothetical protein [Halobacillus naozhouensis]WFT76230.1 hypothetical protein P9989_07665 [Halobacillus naozhouensis]
METYYINFHMVDGSKIQVTKEEDENYDFYIRLRKLDNRWYNNGNQLINLDNVKSIFIQTQTEKNEISRKNSQDVEALSKLNL